MQQKNRFLRVGQQLEEGKAEFAAKEEEFNQQYEAGMAQIEEGEALLAAAGRNLTERKQSMKLVCPVGGSKKAACSLQASLDSGMLSEEELLRCRGRYRRCSR